MVDRAHNSLVRVHLYLLHLIDYFLSDPANMRDHPVCLLPLQPLHPEQDPLLYRPQPFPHLFLILLVISLMQLLLCLDDVLNVIPLHKLFFLWLR